MAASRNSPLSGARNAVDAIARPLSQVGGLLDTLTSIEREMRGMRKDFRETINALTDLRTEVANLNDDIHGIRTATESLDSRIDSRLADLSESLKDVNAIAARFARFGRRNRAATPADAEPADGEADDADVADHAVDADTAGPG